jgi:hypothetical protein
MCAVPSPTGVHALPVIFKCVQCLVPPGYYLKVTSPDNGTLKKCPYNWNGQAFYHSGWSLREKASGPDPAAACTACGEGLRGRFVDVDEIRDTGVVSAQDEFPGLVASTRWSCCEWYC